MVIIIKETHLQNVLLVPLRYGADGDGGELGFLLVHNVRRNIGGLAQPQFQAFIHLQVWRWIGPLFLNNPRLMTRARKSVHINYSIQLNGES